MKNKVVFLQEVIEAGQENISKGCEEKGILSDKVTLPLHCVRELACTFMKCSLCLLIYKCCEYFLLSCMQPDLSNSNTDSGKYHIILLCNDT